MRWIAAERRDGQTTKAELAVDGLVRDGQHELYAEIQMAETRVFVHVWMMSRCPP